MAVDDQGSDYNPTESELQKFFHVYGIARKEAWDEVYEGFDRLVGRFERAFGNQRNTNNLDSCYESLMSDAAELIGAEYSPEEGESVDAALYVKNEEPSRAEFKRDIKEVLDGESDWEDQMSYSLDIF